MGVDRKSAFLLIKEASERPFAGSVLQLGKQDIAVSWKLLSRFSRRADFQSQSVALDNTSFVSDVDFFKYLGFTEVHSLDNSAFEGADIVFDMNSKDLPENLKNRYDAIFDGGTMEHVFDGPQFLANVFAMLKVGGRIVHFSPTFNHINHGFYFYSPTFFMDYYQANKFTIHRLLLISDSLRGAYSCDCMDRETYASVDKLTGFHGAYYSFVVAAKTADSRSGVIPQQGVYVSLWGGGARARSKGYQILKGLYRKNAAYFNVMYFLRRQFLNSWVYRQYANRSIEWKRLP